ncbi:hypothetical protein [Streptomyces kronopolitis]
MTFMAYFAPLSKYEGIWPFRDEAFATSTGKRLNQPAHRTRHGRPWSTGGLEEH